MLFLINKLDEMSRLFLGRAMPDVISGDSVLIIVIGQVALIVGYLAWWRCFSPRVGRWGRVSLGLFTVGGVVLALGHASFVRALNDIAPAFDGLFLLVLLGLLLLLIGLVWFGVINLRNPVTSRWRWLPLATGLMGIIGFIGFSGTDINAAFLLFRTLFALGLIGLGVVLWSDRPAVSAQTR